MMTDLSRAIQRLQEGHYTCVLVKDASVYTATERGVKPLLQWLDEKTDLQGFSAADKVVGRAAAFLYVLLGVKAVYATVISKPSVALLRSYGIDVSFELEVDAIRNRAGTGFCPMEQAVMGIDTPQDAYLAIQEKLKQLSKQT